MPKIMNRTNKQSGFSLIEVMIVIAIIAIVSAIAVPSYFSWRPKHDLNRAVREYHNLLYKAKSVAVKDRGDCQFTFAPAAVNTQATGYTVICDDQDITTCQGASSCTFVKTVVLATDYNSDIVMSSNGVNFTVATVDFNSMGESQVGSPLVIFSHPNVAKRYRLNALISGAIKLEEL